MKKVEQLLIFGLPAGAENVPSGSCEEIACRANNAIAKLASVGRLRM